MKMKKIKDKYWKYVTIILMIIGIASLFLSNATAFPYEMSVNSTMDKSKTYEMINAGAQHACIITDFDPNEIDQVQDFFDVYYKIGIGNSGCSVLQPAVNDREPMTGFQVAIGKHGTPSDDLYMGIMYPWSNSPFAGDNYMLLGLLSASSVPEEDTFYWFGISDKNLDIPSGGYNSLSIVVMSFDDPDDSDYWMWGAGSGNPYPTYRPMGWNTNWYGEGWQDEMLSDGTIDMCFVTYTTDGGNGNEVPVISITTASWVTANIGFACLIGAAISGCKWATFVIA